MATRTVEHRINEFTPYLRPLTVFNLLFAAQLVAAVVYGAVFEVPVSSFRRFLIPFIWVAIGVMAVWYTKPASAEMRYRFLGATISASYFVLVLYLSGMIGPSTAVESTTGSAGVGVEWWASLGWGPIVVYSGEWISAALIPYQLVGYLALAYLIYAAVLDITKSAAAGVLGLIPCPGCAAPLFAPLLAGAAGASSAFALLLVYTYEIATIFFIGAVALLYWRPTAEALSTSLSYNRHRIAGGLALVVAAIHLFHPQLGFPRLVQQIHLGTLYDPRPLAFTISGLAIIVGILLVLNGIATRRVYLLGMALMLTYLVGYIGWHTVLDHGAFWPHIEAYGHSNQGTLETIALHLLNEPRAFASKAAEMVLFVLLGVLYRRDLT